YVGSHLAFVIPRLPPHPTLFPYTTLFRSQTEALDAFDRLANDPALHLFMEFRAGDVQLVCNHSLLHDRTAFEDWSEPRRKRHLRSEEHTSELQSLAYLVCRLLHEQKKAVS